MPTIADLERLDALLERLIPLANVRRGELIQAASWNTLVEALIEVTRAVLAEDQPEAVPEHDHQGEVSMSWLDPGLRSLIERGPLQDPVSEKRLRETERRSLRFNDQVGTLEADLRGLRQRLDEVITRDVKREADVIRFDKQLQQLPRTLDQMQSLQVTFNDLRGNLQEALDLRDNILVNGEPVNLADVMDRLAAADELRQRLTRANGQLLDASALEIELQTLTNTFVDRDELDDILDNRQLELSDEQLGTLQVQIAEGLRAEQQAVLDQRLGAFQQAVTAQVDSRLADVDGRVAAAAANLEADLRGALLETLRPEIDTAVSGSLAPFTTRLDTLDAALADVRGALDLQLGGLRERLTGLETGLDGLRGDFGALQGNLGTLQNSLGALQNELGGLRDAVNRFDGQMADLSGLVGSFDGRIAEAERGAQAIAGLERSVGQLEERLSGFDDRISGFDLRLRDLEGGIRDVSTSVERFGTDVGALRSDLDRFSTQLGGLSTRVGTLERGTGGVDFRTISGIGDAMDRRLREAGITTFEALAALNPEQLAGILSVPAVRARAIIREARRLSG